METLKLYDEFKRLLEYSGKPVEGISLTADGVIAQVTMGGQTYAIFITPVLPKVLKVAK